MNQCFSYQTHLNYQSKTSKLLIFSNTENKRENCGLIFAVNCNWPQQIYIFQYNYAYYLSTKYEKCEELQKINSLGNLANSYDVTKQYQILTARVVLIQPYFGESVNF